MSQDIHLLQESTESQTKQAHMQRWNIMYLDSCNTFSGKNIGENKCSKSETETSKMWKHLDEGTTPMPATLSGNTCFNKLALCRNNCQHVNRITVKSEWISKLFQTAKSNRCQRLLWTVQKYFLQPTLIFQLQLRNCTSKGFGTSCCTEAWTPLMQSWQKQAVTMMQWKIQPGPPKMPVNNTADSLALFISLNANN